MSLLNWEYLLWLVKGEIKIQVAPFQFRRCLRKPLKRPLIKGI